MECNLVELLKEKSNGQSKFFFNIMPIDNIPSVMENGILSFYEAQKIISHVSVALNDVQTRRENVQIPNGNKLHSYANLYFTCKNPMMYKRKDCAESLCVLVISPIVLNFEGCILSDQNAARDLVKFYTPYDGLNNIDFNLVFAQYWTDPDPYRAQFKKAIKCAEILIPNCVPYEYILGAFVLNKDIKEKLISMGFDKKISVNPSLFFR